MAPNDLLIEPDEPILITGATGFIGPTLVQSLLNHGFRNLRALARPSSDAGRLEAIARGHRGEARVHVIRGNLLSREDCIRATTDVSVIFHLAVSARKSFPDAFMNSVVTTRNLLEASLRHARLRRFVNVSSFAVYTNTRKTRRRLLDESCPVETHAELRGDAYGFAKIKQDEIVSEYGRAFGVPYVIVRPGSVYGPGKTGIPAGWVSARSDSFSISAGRNPIPLTYVDNCADAIVLAGLTRGVDGEVFNVVDDDLPSSRQFLRLYKRHVRRFPSLYVPHVVSYGLCWLWETYSRWSEGQLPPVFNRQTLARELEEDALQQREAKVRLGWTPRVPCPKGLTRYFQRVPETSGMLRVAIVGCGKIADSHASQIQRIRGCEIVGVCDREPLMARQLFERFPVKRISAMSAELLSEARPDVVHITTPPQSHFELATYCLERGCHVYVEKPFTLNAARRRGADRARERERASDHGRP